jgi:hypothetical protein
MSSARGGASNRTVRDHILQEIQEIVAEAAAAGETLRVGAHAKRLKEAYPSAGFSVGRITDELILAATKASVAVEIDRIE